MDWIAVALIAPRKDACRLAPQPIARIAAFVPVSRLARCRPIQPVLRAWLPGVPRSIKSIASKWERVGSGDPVAWTATIPLLLKIGSSGDKAGCSPKNPSRLRDFLSLSAL